MLGLVAMECKIAIVRVSYEGKMAIQDCTIKLVIMELQGYIQKGTREKKGKNQSMRDIPRLELAPPRHQLVYLDPEGRPQWPLYHNTPHGSPLWPCILFTTPPSRPNGDRPALSKTSQILKETVYHTLFQATSLQSPQSI